MGSGTGAPAARVGSQVWEQGTFLHSLLEAAPIGVAVVSGPENRLELVNPVYRRLIGWPAGSVVGRTLREVFPPSTAQLAEGYIAEVYRTARTVMASEIPVETGEPPRTTYWDVHYVPLTGEDGQVQAVLMLALPVTDKVRARQDAEALAKQTEERAAQLQAMLTAIAECTWVFDAAGRVAYVSESTLHQLGLQRLSPEVLQELGTLAAQAEVYRPDGAPVRPEERLFARALRGETVIGEEEQIKLPGGPLRWARVSAAPVRDSEGYVTGAVLTTIDITAQKEAQAERERLLTQLEAAHRNLQTILNRLPDGVFVVDTRELVVLHNETIRRYLGRDLLGLSLADLRREYGFVMAGGEPFPPGQAPLERALRGELVSGVEIRLILPGDRRVDALEGAAPLYGPEGAGDGRITGAVVTLTDITLLKEAQAERERLLAQLEAAHRNLRTILDHLPDAVLVVNPLLRVTLCNEAARRYTGRDLAGQLIPDLYRESDFRRADGQPFPQGEAPVERALRGEEAIGVDVNLRLPDGRRLDVLKSAVPLRAPDGTVQEVAAVMTDVTLLKQADRAKDEFISVAAHELRTPLTSLKGHAQILLRQAARANWRPEDQRNLRVIDEQVDRLNDLIERLLNVSRIRLGRLQLNRAPMDIVALARAVAEELQVTTEAHRISVHAEVLQLIGSWDEAAVRQVLMNLVSNAIKYAPGGPIDIHIRQEDNQAVVSVSDRGPGIPPERQAQLFEAFTRGVAEEYRRTGGLGLGLYISRGIVQAHGGRIWVESQVGVGSTFTFTLPL